MNARTPPAETLTPDELRAILRLRACADSQGTPLSEAELDLLLDPDVQVYLAAIKSEAGELRVVRTEAVDIEEAVIQALGKYQVEHGPLGDCFTLTVQLVRGLAHA